MEDRVSCDLSRSSWVRAGHATGMNASYGMVRCVVIFSNDSYLTAGQTSVRQSQCSCGNSHPRTLR